MEKPGTTTVRKRGTIVLPARIRKRFGLEDGTLVIVEETDKGILIRPAMAVPLEVYSDERMAEFILSNAIDDSDYRQARDTVREMGLDPDSIAHDRPAGQAV